MNPQPELAQYLKALGPLAPLYQTADVLSVVVDAPDAVFVERQGRLEETPVRFPSPEALRATIDAVLALADVALGPARTTAAIRFPDSSRFVAAISPTSVGGPCMVVHKAYPARLTWEQLATYHSVSPEMEALLRRATRMHRSILVAGDTASGKTTVANLIAETILPEQRIVIVEEDDNLCIRHQRLVHLVTGAGLTGYSAGPALTLDQLITFGVGMRPDWLVIGELCGPEAMQVLQTFARGYAGITTIHATSISDALARLETMCLMANLGLGLSEIRALVASALHVVTFQRRMPDGSRKLVEIAELQGLDDESHYRLQPLFHYDTEKASFEQLAPLPAWAL